MRAGRLGKATGVRGLKTLASAKFIDCSTRDCEASRHNGSSDVTLPTLLSLLPMLFGMGSWGGPDPLEVRSLVVQDETILRVPVRPLPPPRFEWVERKGPKCLPVSAIRGALLTGPNHVDFMLPQKQRIRATFDDDCPALDFYGGFYVEPVDGAVCAKREEIRLRAGSTCRIERFRSLVPRYKR